MLMYYGLGLALGAIVGSMGVQLYRISEIRKYMEEQKEKLEKLD